jgi:hypothetical protein
MKNAQIIIVLIFVFVGYMQWLTEKLNANDVEMLPKPRCKVAKNVQDTLTARKKANSDIETPRKVTRASSPTPSLISVASSSSRTSNTNKKEVIDILLHHMCYTFLNNYDTFRMQISNRRRSLQLFKVQNHLDDHQRYRKWNQ